MKAEQDGENRENAFSLEEAVRTLGKTMPQKCETKLAWWEALVRALSTRHGISEEHLIKCFEEGLRQNDQLQEPTKEQILEDLTNRFSAKAQHLEGEDKQRENFGKVLEQPCPTK